MTVLHATIDRTDAHTPGDSFADIPGFSSVESIAGTSSVVLLVAQVQGTEGGTTDSALDFRFTIDASATNSPIMVGFTDRGTDDETMGARLVWAVDGLSTGNHTFAVQARKRIGGTPVIDTRTRSFQIIEFDADASLLIDTQSTAAMVESTASWANITDLSATVTPASGSLLLFLFNAVPNDGSTGGKRAEFRFILDGTQDGPIGSCSINGIDEMDGVSMMWAETGHAATSQTIAIQWRTVNTDTLLDDALNRTFQVIEITDNFNLATDLLLTSAQTTPDTYEDMTGMTGDLTPDGTDSIILWMGAGVITARSDANADLRLADDGTREGAELITWTDSTLLVSSWSLARFKTGLSGSHTFSLEWQKINTAPTADTGRERSFQIVAFDAVGGAGVATPGVIGTSATLNTPVLVGPAVTAPGAIATSVVLNTPIASAPQTVTPAQIVPPVMLNTPTPVGSAIALPNQVALTAVLNTPTLVGPAAVTPAQITPPIILHTPTLLGKAVALPNQVALTAVLNNPTLVGPAVATPAQITLTPVVHTPTAVIPGGAGVATPAQIASLLTMLTPTASAPQTVTPAQIAAAITMLTPTLVGPAVVGPAEVSLAAVLNAPTLVGGGNATPGLIAVVAVLNTPTTSNTDVGGATTFFGIYGVGQVLPT